MTVHLLHNIGKQKHVREYLIRGIKSDNVRSYICQGMLTERRHILAQVARNIQMYYAQACVIENEKMYLTPVR